MNAISEPLADRPMLADLRRQAAVLTALVERRADFHRLGKDLAARGGRLFAFGSGDGWFAARSAADYARQVLGLDYTAASSLEALSYLAPLMGPAASLVRSAVPDMEMATAASAGPINGAR